MSHIYSKTLPIQLLNKRMGSMTPPSPLPLSRTLLHNLGMQHKKTRLHAACATLALAIPLCTGFSATSDSPNNQNGGNDTSVLSRALSESTTSGKFISASPLSKDDDDDSDEDDGSADDSDDNSNDSDSDGDHPNDSDSDNDGNTGGDSDNDSPGDLNPGTAQSPSAPLRGITLTSIKDLDKTLSVIRSSEKKLTVRVVIQHNFSIEQYRQAIEALRPHAYIMVEVLDATNWAPANAESLKDLTEQAISSFGDKVDIWEIGNELNGSWLGNSPQEINQKVEAAYDVVKAHGGRTAITLNYWSHRGCYEKSWENLGSFVKTMPQKLRQVDYMFLSVYEFSCSPAQRPSADELSATLKQLGKTFSSAKLGIGEIAANGPNDDNGESSLRTKQRIAKRYYGMQNELAQSIGNRYVGGYFWWYFYEDAVTRSAPMWPTLKQLLNNI